MADNVTLPGTGVVVGAKDVSSVLYQKVILADDTGASTPALPASTAISDDAAFTPATSKVIPAGFTLDDTSPDSVDEGDIGAARITPDRRQIVQVGESGANLVSGTASATGTTSTQVIAGVDSNYLYISSVTVYNSSSTDTGVILQDGSGGTTKWVIPAPARGGAHLTFNPPLRLPTSGNGLFFASQSSVTTMYVSAAGYKASN